MKPSEYLKFSAILIIALICTGIFYVRHQFDALYGSGYTQKLTTDYTLFMESSRHGFLVDSKAGTEIPVRSPRSTACYAYGEYNPPTDGYKYFLIDIAKNRLIQLKTDGDLAAMLKKIGVSAPQPAAETETEFTEAAKLASELLTKLEQNTPFSFKDGERFFGPVAIPSLNVFLLQELGYLNGFGRPVRPLPKYSPFGELLRMNREIFIPSGKTARISFFPANELHKNHTTGKFGVCDKNEIFVHVRMCEKINDIEYSGEKLVCFDYSASEKFFFAYGFSVNGKSVLGELGFYTKKHDEYNYPIPAIKADVLANLKLHLAQLEQSESGIKQTCKSIPENNIKCP